MEIDLDKDGKISIDEYFNYLTSKKINFEKDGDTLSLGKLVKPNSYIDQLDFIYLMKFFITQNKLNLNVFLIKLIRWLKLNKHVNNSNDNSNNKELLLNN